MIKSLFIPYTQGRHLNLKFLAGVQLIILMVIWTLLPNNVGIPSPSAIAIAWNELATTKGLLVELMSSISTITQALLMSAIISISLAYLVTADIFRAPGAFIASLRFLGFAGLTYLFTLWTDNGNQLKLSLLTFGMTVFLARSTIDEAKNIPQSEIDYGRSLGLRGWGLAWEMVIRARLATMIDLVRQNAAIGWTLIVLVEGLVQSEGGIGRMLLVLGKNFNLSAVFAIQLTILFYGVVQDMLLSYLRTLICPYAELTRSDK